MEFFTSLFQKKHKLGTKGLKQMSKRCAECNCPDVYKLDLCEKCYSDLFAKETNEVSYNN
ncbi:hypothetical protein [Microcystis phage MaeS]|nr:hypothetical protein [Microcystis phage MaeS]